MVSAGWPGTAGHPRWTLSGLSGTAVWRALGVRRIQTRWVAGRQDLGGSSVHGFPHGAGGTARTCWGLGQGVCRGRGDCGSDFPSQGSDLFFSPLPAHPPTVEFRAVLP